MINYTSNVKLVNNKLEYFVPNVQKITGAKYKWVTENKGIPNTKQCECCFEYTDVIKENINIKKITQNQYDDFCKVITTCDKTQIHSDGVDCSKITAQFPEGGGIARFIITKPNNEKKIIEIQIPENKIAILPKEETTTTEKGTITINVKSNKWHDVTGLGVIYIEST